jgi:hypothetical protein
MTFLTMTTTYEDGAVVCMQEKKMQREDDAERERALQLVRVGLRANYSLLSFSLSPLSLFFSHSRLDSSPKGIAPTCSYFLRLAPERAKVGIMHAAPSGAYRDA